jgi:hypothetical protein
MRPIAWQQWLQNFILDSPWLNGAGSESTSEVWTSAILKWLRSYEIKNYGFKITFSGMTSPLNFMKIYHLIQKLLIGDRQTGDS